MIHVKIYANKNILTEEEKANIAAVKSKDRIAVTPEEQMQAVKGHPKLRNYALNRTERREIYKIRDKAKGRGFTKSNKEGRNKRRAN